MIVGWGHESMPHAECAMPLCWAVNGTSSYRIMLADNCEHNKKSVLPVALGILYSFLTQNKTEIQFD